VTADVARTFAAGMWAALGGPADALDSLAIEGEGALASAFHTTDLAAASIGVAALAVAEFAGDSAPVAVDRRLASGWFGFSIRPQGWSLPSPWDPIAGDYAARDGWIRLHTNAPHHRRAAERVLGSWPDRAAMAAAVAGWDKASLEAAIVAAGGCAAQMFDIDTWRAHPQGQAVAAEPLIQLEPGSEAVRPLPPVDPSRPLAGIKVLDLTRVLAGPVATRFLAGYGAQVLRIDPPDWDEPSVAPEVTLGKRCARLDLSKDDDRRRFEALLAEADVLVHGYRHGALKGLGYDHFTRRRMSPGLVDVALTAYGWTGPWAVRRGFDSLVQMSCGIAAAGMAQARADKPVPLPVQALDHATGYLMAAAVVRGLTARAAEGRGVLARLSLARTAKLLIDAGMATAEAALAAETADDLSPGLEATTWGPSRRLRAPAAISGKSMHWQLSAAALGTSEPNWA
jgi:hypothetical protein